MSTRVILHIGMPKCGSSALQTALSRAPELRAADAKPVRYVAIQNSGALLYGNSLRIRSRTSATGYVISARASQLATLGSSRLFWLRSRLAWSGARARLVLSNEAWGNTHADFMETRILERLGLEAEVVLYVRPQVEWANSAWWQWGAWTAAATQDFSRWISRLQARVQWGEVARQWQQVPGVSSVRVRLLPKAITADFCELIGVEAPAEVSTNASLPAAVLRLLQRHPQLRGGAHEAALDFALGRHLHLERSPAPWVIPRADAATLIESCRAGNERLLEYLEPAQQQAMRANPRWWSADCWADRVLESPAPQPAESAELDRLAAAAFTAVRDLDARTRHLESVLAENRSGPSLPWRQAPRVRRKPR